MTIETFDQLNEKLSAIPTLKGLEIGIEGTRHALDNLITELTEFRDGLNTTDYQHDSEACKLTAMGHVMAAREALLGSLFDEDSYEMVSSWFKQYAVEKMADEMGVTVEELHAMIDLPELNDGAPSTVQ